MSGSEAKGTGSLLKYAELLLRKGMHEEACLQLQELLRLDPDCGEAHYTLAVVSASEGLPEKAAEHFGEALRITPGDARALNGLGVVSYPADQVEDLSIRPPTPWEIAP